MYPYPFSVRNSLFLLLILFDLIVRQEGRVQLAGEVLPLEDHVWPDDISAHGK